MIWCRPDLQCLTICLSGGLFCKVDGRNVYHPGENVREKKTNRGQSLLLYVNIASFPQNRQKMFSDATNLASMVEPSRGEPF